MKTYRRSICIGIGIALLGLPSASMAAKWTVNPGESIQAAVDAAAPGDKIFVLPGTYQETHGQIAAVTINKPLKLMAKISGAERKAGVQVVIIPGPGNLHGILAEPNPGDPPIDGLTIKGFTVQGFSNNGIYTRYVNKFKIERNTSIDNLENGIFPTLSTNGKIKRNVAYGSEDSAMWIEASEHVRVLKNVLYNSPTGLEVTISNDIELKGNEAYGNAVGIGLYHPSAASLPPLPGTMASWVVKKNYVHDNNGPNTAPVGSMPAGLPVGGGILLLGIDDAEITGNTVENNDFYGIAIVDYCLAQSGTSFDCNVVPPVVEQYPERNRITKNKLSGNGTNPDPAHPMAPFAADFTYIVVDFSNSFANCSSKNKLTTQSSLGPPLLPVSQPFPPGC